MTIFKFNSRKSVKLIILWCGLIIAIYVIGISISNMVSKTVKKTEKK